MPVSMKDYERYVAEHDKNNPPTGTNLSRGDAYDLARGICTRMTCRELKDAAINTDNNPGTVVQEAVRAEIGRRIINGNWKD